MISAVATSGSNHSMTPALNAFRDAARPAAIHLPFGGVGLEETEQFQNDNDDDNNSDDVEDVSVHVA